MFNCYPFQATASKKKPKHGGRPAWSGNWKLPSPRFFRSKEKKKKQMQGGFLENGIKKIKVFDCISYKSIIQLHALILFPTLIYVPLPGKERKRFHFEGVFNIQVWLRFQYSVVRFKLLFDIHAN